MIERSGNLYAMKCDYCGLISRTAPSIDELFNLNHMEFWTSQKNIEGKYIEICPRCRKRQIEKELRIED